MAQVRTILDWMAEREVSMEQLIAASRLEVRVVKAIVHGRYTPSPEQRRQLSDALGINPDQVAWGHIAQVEHIQGHGPQFGRSP